MCTRRFPRQAALTIGLVLLVSIPASSVLAQVTFRRIAVTGDQAPGTPLGAVYSQFGTFPGVGDDFPPRIDAAGNVAFHAVLTGTGVTGVNIFDGNALGLWKHVAGVTSLLGRQDEPAPGTAAGVEFSRFSSGLVPEPPGIASGRAGFAGALRGPGVDEQFGSNAHGVWRETAGGIQLVVRMADPAPGLPPGHIMRVIGVPHVAPTGITFNGVYATPGESPTSVDPDQEGFWSDRSGTLEAVVFGGQPAPGVEPGVTFGIGHSTAAEGVFRSWASNEAMKFAVNGNLAGPGIFELNDEGIWIEQNGALTLLVREGDPSPAVGPGVHFGINSGIDTFGDVVAVEMNGPGAIIFGARHRGGSVPFTRGIWTNRSGALELVAYGSIPLTGSAPGSPAPGMGPGATFSTIPFVELNDASQIALSGFATIDMNFDNQPHGVWWDRPGALTLVAREGDPAPGLPGLEFAGFNRSLSFGSGGHLAFLADLREAATGEARGVAQVMVDPQGGFHFLARSGEVFDVAGDGSDLRVVTDFLPGTVSAAGEIPLELHFLDGSSGLFVGRIEAPAAGVPPGPGAATRVSLAAPEPNPRVGDGPLTLRFALDRSGMVRLALYDISGREVTARAAELRAVGPQAVEWHPGRLAPGVYFARLELESGASATARWAVLE